MTANTMRESVLKILTSYKQEMERYGYYTSNPGVSVDDFEEIADEIVAWQAAQSVPVVGEPVAYGVPNSRPTESLPFMQVMLQIPANAQYPELLVPLIVKPTNYITATELERLRKDAFMWEARYKTLAVLFASVAPTVDEIDDSIDAAMQERQS